MSKELFLSADGQTLYSQAELDNAPQPTGYLITVAFSGRAFGGSFTYTSDQGFVVGPGFGVGTPFSFAAGAVTGGTPNCFATGASVLAGWGIVAGSTLDGSGIRFAGIGTPQFGIGYGFDLAPTYHTIMSAADNPTDPTSNFIINGIPDVSGVRDDALQNSSGSSFNDRFSPADPAFEGSMINSMGSSASRPESIASAVGTAG